MPVATHDGLTGLHAQPARLPVSLMLIDIEHFKAYNDRYGHQR